MSQDQGSNAVNNGTGSKAEGTQASLGETK